MRPKLFVHIPKTAGTSFRFAAEDYFGVSRICYDYGDDSPVTSSVCKDNVYRDNDYWTFYQSFIKNQVEMLAGHFNTARYVSGFGVCNTFTFLREPIQRMVSEYHHFVRHMDFGGSLSDFYSQPNMANRLSRVLKDVPIEAMGFVGLTERYNDSLTLINHKFKWDIKPREENIGKEHLHKNHKISEEDYVTLKQRNKLDLELYKKYVDIFEQRMKLFSSGSKFAHVKVTGVTKKKVAGWAWWSDCGDAPVEVEVYLNDKCVGSVRAQDFRRGLLWLHPPRGSYVGFSLPINAQSGDRLQCRVHETGQWFPPQAMQVPEQEE